MRRYLDLSTWIFLFALLPLTVIILLSQNTVPGDLFYPMKRGMEDVILAAASVNPSTQVAFRTDLTEKRFQEAQQLLVSKADTTAFTDFVDQVSTTQQDVSNLSNQQEKIQASEKLIAKIDQYQAQLAQVQTQVQIAQSGFSATPLPSSAALNQQPSSSQQPGAAPTTNPTISNTLTSSVQPTSQSIQPTTKPTQSTSSTTQPVIPITTPISSPIAASPLPSIQPSAATTIASSPIKAEEVKITITNTQDELKKIKEQLQKDKEDAQFKSQVQEEEKKIKNGSGDNGNNR